MDVVCADLRRHQRRRAYGATSPANAADRLTLFDWPNGQSNARSPVPLDSPSPG